MRLNKMEVLTLLRESESFVSGQDLCDRYQVSRQAVWKLMKQLKEEGYLVEAVSNRGYRLVESPDVLSKAELMSRMATKQMGQELYYFESTGSTNADAKRLAEEGAPQGTLVVADAQTQGRGRRGRSWESPAGESCYFTLLLKPDFAPDKASMLTLVMAHSVAMAISELAGMEAGIKWPNDIVMQGKKVCGILTEMTLESDYIQHVVIGVGININQENEKSFPEEVRAHAGSVRMICGKQINRAELVGLIMKQFEKDYAAFLETEDLSGLKQSYDTFLVNLDKEVKVLDPKGEFTGTARGINEKGELLVELEDGSLEKIYSGEVSVRGLYGYV